MTLLEPASSLTNFALGSVALLMALQLVRVGRTNVHWRMFFACIAIAALWGGVHHGFIPEGSLAGRVSWAAISVTIAVALSFALAGTVATVLGDGRGQGLLKLRIISVFALLLLVGFGQASITVLMATEGLAMLAVLGLWLHAWGLGRSGSGLVLTAIFASMLAAAAKGSGAHFSLGGWEFDPDSIYHMAQLPGIFLLFLALRQGTLGDARPPEAAASAPATPAVASAL